MSEQESGWYVDPSGRHRLRYWSGTQWSDQVNDGNVNFADPIEQDRALVPPAPGTKPVQPQQQPQQQPANISVQTNEPRTGMVGILIGALVIVVLVIALLIALDDDNDSGGSGDNPVSTTTGGDTPTTAAPTTAAPTTAAPDSGG
jgi:hypothetical protein